MKRKFLLLISVMVILTLVLSACAPGGNAPASGKTKIRVATEAAYPPFEMVDETTKELIGFDIELMDAIAEKANLEVEYKNTPFDPLLAGMATCQFDAAVSAITITADRAKEMGFSDPYINAGQIITVRVDNTDITSSADLVGKTLGVQLGTTGQIEAEKIEGVTVKSYDSVDLAFLDLANGQMDAVIVDYPTTLNYVRKFSDKIKTTGAPFTDESYGIAVCKTNGDLLAKINKALAELKAEGFLTKLEEKWMAE
jgi:polar amino acid transport system substrate-binding protein